MPKHSNFTACLVALCLAAPVVLTACDDSSSKPPPSAAGGNSGGGGISNLANSPSSLMGKSAARGRDVGKDISNYQNEAAGIAAEGTGEAEPVTVSGVTVSVPKVWTKRAPSSSMRVAEYVVAPDSGSGEAVVVFFGQIGGDVNSNINRWRDQMSAAGGGPVEDTNTQHRTINGVKVTTVSMEGTLKGGTMGGPSKDMPNSSFRAAIIEGPQGSAYIKFTGPATAVHAADATWEAMINGMRK